MNSELIQIENKSGKVKLTDAVTPQSIGSLIDQISKLFGSLASEQGQDFTAIINAGGEAVDTLEIEINSPGGSIFDGYNIYHEIKSLQERGVIVTATITGMAASMASVIAMAADKIQMVPHGRMMIHEASQGVRGNAEQLRKAADTLEGISSDIAEIYAHRTGRTLGEVRAMMKEETWMKSSQALELGFIDEILNSRNEKQTVDIGNENSLIESMSLLSRLTQPSNIESLDKISALENQILGHDAEITELQVKIDTAELALQEASEIAARNTELESKVLEIPTFIAKISDLESKLVELEATNIVTTEKIENAAAVKLAAMGHGEPINLGIASVTESNSKTVTREGFNTMNPKQKSEFAKSGGKIIN